MMEQRLSIEASIDNLDEVNGFVESHLEEAGCSMKQIMQMSLAVEEVFVNIAHYAYSKKDADGKAIPDTGTGPAEIILNADDSKILLTFIDEGMEYDPLKKKTPIQLWQQKTGKSEVLGFLWSKRLWMMFHIDMKAAKIFSH